MRLLTALVLAACATACSEVERPPDFKRIAEKVIGLSAHVMPRDVVVVRGDVRDCDLLSELSFASMRRQAYPLLLLEREADQRRYFDEVPATYDADPTLELKLVELADVQIEIVGTEDPTLFQDVELPRFNARKQRRVVVNRVSLQKSQRWITIGNGLYPSDATAAQLGLTRPELARLFWSSIDIDYRQLEAVGRALHRVLASGTLLHITSSDGSDLQVGIASRPVFANDGAISDEDIARGGANAQAWLPAGEVYLTPVPGTARGSLHLARLPFEGQEVQDLRLSFEAGALTAMSAQRGLEGLQKIYDASPPGKEQFSFVDIGINPRFRLASHPGLLSWIGAGMVSFCFGGNSWAGGDNETPMSFCGQLPAATVTVDGVAIVEDGQLRVQADEA